MGREGVREGGESFMVSLEGTANFDYRMQSQLKNTGVERT